MHVLESINFVEKRRNKMQKALSNATTACRCDSLWSITFTEVNTTTQNNLNNLQFMWFVYQRLITYSKDINQQKRDARFDSCIHHEQFLVAKRKDEWWLIVVNHTIEVFSFIFVYIVFILFEYQTLLGSLQEVQWLWPRPTKHRSFSPTWVCHTCSPNSICRWIQTRFQ